MDNEYDFSKENISAAKASFKNKTAGDGEGGPFYTGKQQAWQYRDDKELFLDAVWQGYLDAKRTFKDVKNTDDDRTAFKNLAYHIQNYLDGKEAFNHSARCNSFMADIRKYNEFDARYGQAQKVVNMAFKYLYCCAGAPEDRFTPCHMPLDKITLTWLSHETDTYYAGWSYFTQKRYEAVQNKIRWILGDHILDKELVIYEQLRPKRVVDLKKEYGHDTE